MFDFLRNGQRRPQLSRYLLLSLLLLTFGTAITVDAQQGTGNIIGTVKDSTGATVEGATVDIQNVDTQNKFTLSTNDAGFYNSPPLLPSSNYSVIVTRRPSHRLSRRFISHLMRPKGFISAPAGPPRSETRDGSWPART